LKSIDLLLIVAVFVSFILLIWLTLKKPSLGLAMLIFSLPVFGLSRRFFKGVMPYPSLETIAVIVVLCCTGLGRLKSADGKRRLNVKLEIAIWIFLSACLLSSVASKNPLLSLKILLAGGIVPMVCFLIAYRYAGSPDDIRNILYGFFGFAFFTLFYTIAGYINRVSTGVYGLELYKRLYNEAPVANLLIVSSVTVAVLVYAVPAAFWHRQHGKRFRKILWPAVIAACLATGILSFSRGSWSGLSVAFVASFPLIFRKYRASRAAFVFIIVAAIVIVYFAGYYKAPKEIVQFRFSAPYAERGIQLRLSNYNLAIKSATKHYLWGVGLGQYKEVYEEFPDDPASRGDPLWFAHSLFLTLIPEIGLIGALALLFFFLYILVTGLRRSFSSMDDEIGSLLYALIVGVISYLAVALTSGAHLIAYLDNNAERTYFIAPALIATFITLGCIAAICSRGVDKSRPSGTLLEKDVG